MQLSMATQVARSHRPPYSPALIAAGTRNRLALALCELGKAVRYYNELTANAVVLQNVIDPTRAPHASARSRMTSASTQKPSAQFTTVRNLRSKKYQRSLRRTPRRVTRRMVMGNSSCQAHANPARATLQWVARSTTSKATGPGKFSNGFAIDAICHAIAINAGANRCLGRSITESGDRKIHADE